MNTIRCPQCRLINMEDVRRCRRCGTALSSATQQKSLGSYFRTSNRAARYWVIPLIAIVSVACIYGFYSHSTEVSTPRSGFAATDKEAKRNAPATREPEEVKKLHREFVARLDQNMADRKGKGFGKNQTLAFETLTLLREQQKKTANPSTQKYLNEFCSLVEKYYDQLVRYNSESAHLQEVGQRGRQVRFRVLGDPTLSPDEEASRQVDLRNENVSEARSATVSTTDIDETVKALRDLSSYGAGL